MDIDPITAVHQYINTYYPDAEEFLNQHVAIVAHADEVNIRRFFDEDADNNSFVIMFYRGGMTVGYKHFGGSESVYRADLVVVVSPNQTVGSEAIDLHVMKSRVKAGRFVVHMKPTITEI